MKEKRISHEWPSERVAELIRLFNEGVSFADIAVQFAMTRSAIIGKCGRLDLRRESNRLLTSCSGAAKAGNLLRKLRNGPTKKHSDEPLNSTHESDFAIPKRRRKNIFTLGPRDCKFPVGDPGTPSFFFCGACKLPALPYCAEHALRCFAPPRS
jgi:GcrA cell cycle regulator